tara:strand:- start:729 stop:1394 length:666 start_codon:yes stop_codon:yes gene_type:complete
LLSLSTKAEDNIINLDQSGDDLTLHIEQVGHNNEILLYSSDSKITGDDVSIHLHQHNASSSAGTNTIKLWHLYGDDNAIRWGQGAALTNSSDTTFESDSDDSGGQYAMIDIHGSRNSIVGYQMNSGSGAHTADIYIWGDDNSAWLRQKNNSSKNLDLLIKNDDNAVSVLQKDHAAHTAAITLDGTYGTNLNLTQQTNTAQSYTLIQNCVTVAGCNISVIQQ